MAICTGWASQDNATCEVDYTAYITWYNSCDWMTDDCDEDQWTKDNLSWGPTTEEEEEDLMNWLMNHPEFGWSDDDFDDWSDPIMDKAPDFCWDTEDVWSCSWEYNLCHHWAGESEETCQDWTATVHAWHETCWASDDWETDCDWSTLEAQAAWYPTCDADWESVWEWECGFYEYEWLDEGWEDDYDYDWEDDYHWEDDDDWEPWGPITDGSHYCDSHWIEGDDWNFEYWHCTSFFEICNGFRHESPETCAAAFEAETEFWAGCWENDCTDEDYENFYANQPDYWPESDAEWEALFHWWDTECDNYWKASASVDLTIGADLNVEPALARTHSRSSMKHKVAHAMKAHGKNGHGSKTHSKMMRGLTISR